jgi:propanediol utilization protein
MKRLPVRVIPHHIRLSQADREFLFGQEPLPVGAAAKSGWLDTRCTLATALNRLTEVQVSSDFVPHSYAVITRGDAAILQLDPPVRTANDILETPTLTLIGPGGRHLTIPVIVALRHLHLLPQDARELQIGRGEFVMAVVQSDNSAHRRSAGRDLILAGVEARVGSETASELHLDVEEANASGISSGGLVKIIKTPPPSTTPPDAYYPQKRLINERDVLDAIQRHQKIKITPGMLITPAARELGKERSVFV